MSLLRALVVGSLLVVLGVGGVLGWRWWQERQATLARREARTQSLAAVDGLLEAWEAGNWHGMASHVAAPPPDLAETVADTMRRLRAGERELSHGPVRLVDRERPEAGARIRYRVALTIADRGRWTYSGHLSTTAVEGAEGRRWLVEWTPGVLHPQLQESQQLRLAVSDADRAPIVGADGQPIRPGDTQLARLVGDVGRITADRTDAVDGFREVGDPIGDSGLQRLFDDRLAGTPAVRVQIAGPDGASAVTLREFPGRDPAPVRTGLEVDIQRAAEAALADAPGNAAMVVVDPASKAIRAVVNHPEGFDRALAGQYAPGSTFKAVTTIALLRGGIRPGTTVPCPPVAEVGGREFTNFEDAAYGPIPFRRAFFLSCNTAFVQLAADLEPGALGAAAGAVGFERSWDLGLAEPHHSFPEPGDLAERAAAAFGQARVAASPVQMAGVAAAIASGSWDNPWLAAPQREQQPPSDLSDVAPTIRELMREVPRRGTASEAGLPDDIGGKTGTAEVDRGGRRVNDTWFIGFDLRDPDATLAWAVLVEDGRSGGSTAAPLAAKFLAELGRG